MPHNDDSKGDRPKKSWREIDAAREKKGQSRHESGRQEHLPKSQAYRSYKTQLNKLFDGGALPAAMAAQLGSDAPVPAARARRDAAAQIIAASTPKDFRGALQAYTAAHGFPIEEDVLTKLLDLSDETMVLQAIEALAALAAEGNLKRAAAVRGRLKTAQLTCDDPQVQRASAALLAKL